MTNELIEALQDVRAAYRLLYAYNRRVRDCARHLAKAVPLRFLKTYPRFTKSQFQLYSDWWIWDSLPFSIISFLFTCSSDAEESSNVSPGTSLVEIRFVADSALDQALRPVGQAEPFADDPDYPWHDVLKTQSELQIWLLTCTSLSPGHPPLAWTTVFEKLPRPPRCQPQRRANFDTLELFSSEGGEFESLFSAINLAELDNAEAIDRLASSIREATRSLGASTSL